MYEIRPAVMLAGVTGSGVGIDLVRAAGQHGLVFVDSRRPIMTPVRVPPRESVGMPACSRASQATSSNIRCCGSIDAASRGVMPKNSASNPAMSWHETASTCVVHVPRCQRVGGVKSLRIPAISRDPRDRISTVDQQLPETHPARSHPPETGSQYPTTATGSAIVVRAVSGELFGQGGALLRRHTRNPAEKRPHYAGSSAPTDDDSMRSNRLSNVLPAEADSSRDLIDL